MELADLQQLRIAYRAKVLCLERPERMEQFRERITASNTQLLAISHGQWVAFLSRINRNERNIAYLAEQWQRLREVVAAETPGTLGDRPVAAALLAEDVALFRRICREIHAHYTEGVQTQVIGYGEIAASLTLSDCVSLAPHLQRRAQPSAWVYKSLPKFPDADEVERYRRAFDEYSALLCRAGLDLPEQKLAVARQDAEGIKLYIVQRRLDSARIANKLLLTLDSGAALALLRRIMLKISGVFDADVGAGLRLGLDGASSNWWCAGPEPDSPMLYIDTSTPLYRVNGAEQINTAIFLKNTPSFMRAIIRRFFLQDVLDRYYDRRRVLMDLVANLHKDKRPDLVEPAVGIANELLAGAGRTADVKPLTVEEVKAYYREDAFIWSFFQTARRIDRFVIEKILGRRYPFRLPGKIER